MTERMRRHSRTASKRPFQFDPLRRAVSTAESPPRMGVFPALPQLSFSASPRLRTSGLKEAEVKAGPSAFPLAVHLVVFAGHVIRVVLNLTQPLGHLVLRPADELHALLFVL
jgi:hypothetical protein